MKSALKIIGKNSEKIGNTTFTGNGLAVKYDLPDDQVAVRSYAAGKGYGGIVGWDGENATVAGTAIKPNYINDGTAYVNKSDADAAISKMEQEAGIVKDPEKARNDMYGKMESEALGKVTGRKAFSYNPEKDPVYIAYKKQYEREAEHALRRILNDNNTSISGASSAVLSEALAAQNEQLDKITDIIPELYDDAFSRYVKENTMNNEDLEAVRAVADSYYDRLYKSNKDTIERIKEAGDLEHDNDLEREKERRLAEESKYDNMLNSAKIDRELAELEYYADNMIASINSKNASSEYTTLKNAIMRGFFTAEDEAVLPWLKNYRTGNGKYSISPSVASIAYEYQEARAREQGKINAKLGK